MSFLIFSWRVSISAMQVLLAKSLELNLCHCLLVYFAPALVKPLSTAPTHFHQPNLNTNTKHLILLNIKLMTDKNHPYLYSICFFSYHNQLQLQVPRIVSFIPSSNIKVVIYVFSHMQYTASSRREVLLYFLTCLPCNQPKTVLKHSKVSARS